MPDARYPIGDFVNPESTTPDQRRAFVRDIAEFPAHMRAAVAGLSNAQLETPYREGGWTVRQVVHHTSDSHMNAVVRTKLALTEDTPTIKPYDENLWAKLPDAKDPIEGTLILLDQLHARWAGLLETLSDDQWLRPLRHPAIGDLRLDQMIAQYAWHGKHHVAHVHQARASLR